MSDRIDEMKGHVVRKGIGDPAGNDEMGREGEAEAKGKARQVEGDVKRAG